MSEQTTGREVIELVPVDLTQVKLIGKVSKLDATEDAWEFSAPPDPGAYKFKLFLSKDGFKQGRYDPRDAEVVYYLCGVEAKLVSDNTEIDGFTVFAYFSTRIGRRKNISTMAGMIVKMGYKLPNEASDLQIAKMFSQALKKEPIVEGELDWRGAYQESEGKKEWINVFRTYAEFPEVDKVRQHVTMVNDKGGNKHEVRAQATVKRWYGKGEAKQGPVGLVSAPRLAPAKAEPELVEESAPTPAPAKIVRPVAAAVTEDELELLIAEG
jgi:hypothetical protein